MNTEDLKKSIKTVFNDSIPDGSIKPSVLSDELIKIIDSNVELLKSFSPSSSSVKNYLEVLPVKSYFTIDNKLQPNSVIKLLGDYLAFDLSIVNIDEGASGSILVYQSGFKKLVVNEPIVGVVDVPLTSNTLALLEYECLNKRIFIRSSTIIGDSKYSRPAIISDFRSTFSDFTSSTLEWTSPIANNIYDSCTKYDIRYSNSIVDTSVLSIWNSLSIVNQLLVPKVPGSSEKFTISGLEANSVYYVYIKAIRVNYGVAYASDASQFIYFKTLDANDPSRAYKLQLEASQIYTQSAVFTEDGGVVNSQSKLVDEVEKGLFLQTGYPDVSNKNYNTYFLPKNFQRSNLEYDTIIDLNSVYLMDKLFLYSQTSTKVSIFGMKDLGFPWVKINEIKVTYNGWGDVDFAGIKCRFIKISFDLANIGSRSNLPEGVEGFLDFNEYNDTMGKINNLLIYARPIGNKPEKIKEPIRRSIQNRTVDQVVCTNGHGYQQGRIHSLMSGEKMRMYITYSQFLPTTTRATNPYTTIKDMRFRMDEIPWVLYNNGTGKDFTTNLRETYKRYGLKPYLTNTDHVLDYCKTNLWAERGLYINRSIDNYWLPDSWIAKPIGGLYGLEKYHAVTSDPNNYKTIGKITEAVSKKFGNVSYGDIEMFYPINSKKDTGLDLISGLEPENEPNKDWEGYMGYENASEYSALISAAADGNANQMKDEDGVTLKGTRAGNILSIASGLAELQPGYLLSSILNWKNIRKDGSLPVDCFNVHTYCSNTAGGQYSSSGTSSYATTLEEYLTTEEGHNFITLIDLRDRLASNKEIWLSEFGYGESGARNTLSKFQAYSQPGRYIGDWLIPDRHRSDVKGAWTVRGILTMLKLGVNLVNIYGTECEQNFFNATQWGQGAGFEMFAWDKLTNNTPGAKYKAIEASEVKFNRVSFSAMGMFGNIIGNGAYPISRAFWYIATFRSALKGYYFIGMKQIELDSRIMVMCFRHEKEDKGAYAIYLNDSKNDGIRNVEISLPDNVTTYDKINVYVPKIPNPNDVNPNTGIDRLRTGLPTTRTEVYKDGEWKLVNPVEFYNGKSVYSSYALSDAIYPVNPVEGNEVVVFPTAIENPYFPIVGPVQATENSNKNTLTSKQWEEVVLDASGNPTYNAAGNPILEAKSDIVLTWRQVNAICDYVEYTDEGKKGTNGIKSTNTVNKNQILTNVSEYPEYFLFNAIPTTTFKSSVKDLSSSVESADTITLWWNNTNHEDTGYQIFSSLLPTSGYTMLKEIEISSENKNSISGLKPATSYYFKIRPIRGRDLGELSDYSSGRTYSLLLEPTNLVSASKTATSISINWEYSNDVLPDFVSYYVYRASPLTAFVIISNIKDQTIRKFTDGNLAIGANYRYKIRAVGLNGLSNYSNEVSVTTLLATESAPKVQYAKTDKLGNKITVTFDLPIATINDAVMNDFILTEDGNERLVKKVLVDINNSKDVILLLNTDSISDYTYRKNLLLTYKGSAIKSTYGVLMDTFLAQKVYNFIGNYTNLNAKYQINFGSPLEVVPEWNSLGNSPLLLVNTYAKTTGVTMKKYFSGSNFNWGPEYPTSGLPSIPGIPSVVSKSGLTTDYFNSDTEIIKSRLILSGLNNEYKHTIKAFSGTLYGGVKEVKMKISGRYSNKVASLNNLTDFMVLEDLAPTNGELLIDIISKNSGDNCQVHFMTIEEFMPNSSPANNDIYLKSVSVVNNGVEVTSTDSRTITVHVNPVGLPTSYRISEREDFSDASWKATNGLVDYSYDILSSYGDKTLYIQAATSTYESNVKIIKVYLRDVSSVAVNLNNIFLNNDAASTTNVDANIFIEKLGTPTFYKVSESIDLSAVVWLDWSTVVNNLIPFKLSDTLGTKTVYLQLKNETSESLIKSDKIELMANDNPNDYVLTGLVNNTSYGTISVSSVSNGVATATVVASTGYVIESWVGATGDGIGTANGKATLSGISSNVTITCKFAAASSSSSSSTTTTSSTTTAPASTTTTTSPSPTPGTPSGIVNIDFGVAGYTYITPDSDWNNVNLNTTGIAAGGASISLKDSTLNVTGMSLSITSSWLPAEENVKFPSTQTGLPAPYTACRDVYIAPEDTDGTFKITGIASGKTFDIEIYAARAYVGTSTTYTINGISKTLTTRDNVFNIVTLLDVIPNSLGELIVTVRGAAGLRGYIGYMKLITK